MKTFLPKVNVDQRQWHVIDADGIVLGRLASKAASLLMGKHKPTYTPYIDTGDHVVVVNAAKIRMTGSKEDQKMYRWHSGYPGGIKGVAFGRMQAEHPERVIEKAVKGMLPHNPLGRAMFRKLKVYAGPSHPHAAQQPQTLEI